jgi:ATP-dependent Clp protease ATP-binding subunit ClpA
MFERFARDARETVVHAVDEARRRGDRRVGTDHLLLGVLNSPVAADALGVTLEAARAADEGLDTAALHAVGLDLAGASTGWSAISSKGRTPFSSGARETLRDTLAHATAERARAIEMRHIVLALLDRQDPDPAATLVEALGVDRERSVAKLTGSAPRDT